MRLTPAVWTALALCMSTSQALARGARVDARAPADRVERRAPVQAVRTLVSAVLPHAAGDAHRRFYEVRFQANDATAVGGLLDAVADTSTLYEACRRDRFFVHFPRAEWPSAAIPGAPEAYAAALAGSLRTESWFFDAGGAGDLEVRHAALPTAAPSSSKSPIRTRG